MTISEPATMLTDYGLAVVSVYLAIRLRRATAKRPARPVKLWVLGFFLAGLAAAVGGTFHGFALFFSAGVSKGLWNATVFLLGACSAFMVAGTLTASIPRSSPAAFWLLTGLLLSVFGLLLLAIGFRLHEHFNQNDIYHCIQAFAFYFFYRGALQLGASAD